MGLRSRQSGGQYSEVGGGDYDQTPEQGTDYKDFIKYVSDQKMMGMKKFKHSEFKNPMAKDYETMDTTFDYPYYIMPPWDQYDTPGAGGQYGSGQPTTPPVVEYYVLSCKWSGLPDTKIGYTYKTMAVNTCQGLAVLNPHHPLSYYKWSLMGDGWLQPTSGGFSQYCTPSSNAGCTKTAFITLSIGAEICDTLEIIISNTSVAVAYYVCTGRDVIDWGTPRPWTLAQYWIYINTWTITCNGLLHHQYTSTSCWQTALGVACSFASCPNQSWYSKEIPDPSYQNCWVGNLTYLSDAPCVRCSDQRTALMISQGCCPKCV